jgi:hypothetical protein
MNLSDFFNCFTLVNGSDFCVGLKLVNGNNIFWIVFFASILIFFIVYNVFIANSSMEEELNSVLKKINDLEECIKTYDELKAREAMPIHQRFSKELNEPKVLTNPEEFLGPNWQKVLDLWLAFDALDKEEINKMEESYWVLGEDVINSARDVYVAAKEVVGERVVCAAWLAFMSVTPSTPFARATLELIADLPNKVFYDLIMSHTNS